VAPAKEHACLDMKRLIGGDPRMAYNARCASRVADKDVYILLAGETGTGKEVFARAVHEASARAGRPFVALNCAAIPESLIESELFGYKHGAFTGARREGMRGCVLQSSGGTLFLDEIGDMPYALQTRLLRVLESREVVPLGGQAPVTVDLHVISATHRDLKGLVDNGGFREDLYFRLNGISLHLPALRERRDLEAIVRCVLAAENDTQDVISVDHVAFNQLLKYPWPGNIRELRNVIRTALALSDDGIIRLADLPKEIAVYRDAAGPRSGGPPTTVAGPSEQGSCSPLEAAEREALLKELERNRWNVTVSAERLGMSRSTLYRKLKKYDIPVTQAHEPNPGD
jgi:transcriptional regulator of acetoin/glycerol metabolism